MPDPIEDTLEELESINQQLLIEARLTRLACEKQAHSTHLIALVLASRRGEVGSMASADRAMKVEEDLWSA